MLLVAVLAVALGLAAPALAQEAEEDPAEDPADRGTEGRRQKAIDEALKRDPFAGEITVTSRRREEVLQEVPIAGSVIAGDQFEDVAASTISELQAYVPNLSIYQGLNESTS